MFHRIAAAVSGAAILVPLHTSTVAAGGPPSLSFYADDVRWRTVGTPTDFTDTGAPASTFDRIYVLGNGLINVADAAPGDPGFRGGRWAVYPVTWAPGVTPVQYTDAGEVLQAAADGLLTIAATPVREFFCSVNLVPPGQG